MIYWPINLGRCKECGDMVKEENHFGPSFYKCPKCKTLNKRTELLPE